VILIALALLCAGTVLLRGGSLARLAELPLRGRWVPAIALVLQVLITVVVAGGSPTGHRVLHIATYALVALFLWLNRGLPGVAIIAAGTLANAAAIVANLGVMPASTSAERIAGMRLRTGFDNSAPVAHAHLAWLGDVIPWPGPAHNVLSVGDLVIFVGMAVLLHRACARPRPAIRLAPLRQ
jgi:hypothetical protein